MKFTMNAKELKTMIEKGMTGINKKSSLNHLLRLYFEVDNDGIKIFGTDLEHYVEIKSDSVWDIIPGTFAIDIDDIKVLTKMTGNITLEENEDGDKIDIKSGKKIVSIKKCKSKDIRIPVMDDAEQILSVKESWLLETLINLCTFTNTDSFVEK